MIRFRISGVSGHNEQIASIRLTSFLMAIVPSISSSPKEKQVLSNNYGMYKKRAE